LIGSRIDPDPAFERNAIVSPGDYIGADATLFVGTLEETHKPGGLPFPLAHSFALKLEIAGQERMKDQGNGRQAVGGNASWKLFGSGAAIAKFIQDKHAIRIFRDDHYVVEAPNIRGFANAVGIYTEMLHAFGGGEFLQVTYELGHALTDASKDLLRWAFDVGIYFGECVVERDRKPRG
jgi:hypothetical protein